MVGPVGDVPVEAMARFTAAEARLYPMVMTDPAGYQLATSLVGLVANELRRDCADIAAVLAGRDALISRLPQLAADAGLSAGGLPRRRRGRRRVAPCDAGSCSATGSRGGQALDIVGREPAFTKGDESCREVNSQESANEHESWVLR